MPSRRPCPPLFSPRLANDDVFKAAPINTPPRKLIDVGYFFFFLLGTHIKGKSSDTFVSEPRWQEEAAGMVSVGRSVGRHEAFLQNKTRIHNF